MLHGGDLALEHTRHGFRGRSLSSLEIYRLLLNRHNVPAVMDRELVFPPNPIPLIRTAIQSAGRQDQQEVRSCRHLRRNLLRPLARRHAVDVEEYVVAPAR